MDEYQLEIRDIRRTLARLRAEEAAAALIEEYEAELRNLEALYEAAVAMFDSVQLEPRLPSALSELGFGEWTLRNVYNFVYEAAMDAEFEGRDLANVITHTDYAASLLAAMQS